jgi:spore coat protein U-like protein
MKPWMLAVILLAVALAWPGRALSQSCNGSIGTLDFGTVSAVSPNNTDVSGNLSISCSGFGGTPYVRVCANLGLPASGGTWGARLVSGMSSPTGLAYTIYKDAARTQTWTSVWDSPTQSNSIDIQLASGAALANLPVYARVPGNQSTVPAGSYSSTFGVNDATIAYVGYTSSPPACSSSSYATGFIFTVQATVAADCLITATNANLGSVGLITSTVAVPGTITTMCTFGTTYAVSINAGQGTGATVASRLLTRTGGTDTLRYNIYLDGAYKQIWGDGSHGTYTRPATGIGLAQVNTYYAVLAPQPGVKPGTYTDQLIATVTF